MLYRSKHLTFYTILIGMVIVLTSLNIIALNRISYLEQCLCDNNIWLSAFELKQIENEINRLDNETKSVLKR